MDRFFCCPEWWLETGISNEALGFAVKCNQLLKRANEDDLVYFGQLDFLVVSLCGENEYSSEVVLSMIEKLVEVEILKNVNVCLQTDSETYDLAWVVMSKEKSLSGLASIAEAILSFC